MKKPTGILWCPHCYKPHRLGDRVCTETGKTLDRGLHRAEGGRSHPLVGCVLGGRYLVKSVIGSGGLGTVFEGENTFLRREVAIKLVTHGDDLDAMTRLGREAAIIASLQHPNICDVYDFGPSSPFGPYLVTQRLHGETIAHRLRWQPFMGLVETIDIVTQLLSALHAAHASSIVHRDVKPQNVFLIERVGCGPLVKLIDFGLAKDLASSVKLTRPGKALGTPLYMAPEQLTGHGVGPATDIFAVGVLMYAMLTGRHPFAARTAADLADRVLDGEPERMSTIQRPIPVFLERIVLAALEKDPRQRPSTAYAMQQELLQARELCAEIDDETPSSSHVVAV